MVKLTTCFASWHTRCPGRGLGGYFLEVTKWVSLRDATGDITSYTSRFLSRPELHFLWQKQRRWCHRKWPAQPHPRAPLHTHTHTYICTHPPEVLAVGVFGHAVGHVGLAYQGSEAGPFGNVLPAAHAYDLHVRTRVLFSWATKQNKTNRSLIQKYLHIIYYVTNYEV